MSQNDTLTETGSGQAYRNADKKRAVFWQVIHVTFGCYTADGSDLEFFKQRTIGDDHSKLKERIVPAEYSPAPGEAVLLTSTTSVRNKNACLLKTPFDSCFLKAIYLSLCQDRLGTNIGTVEGNRVSCRRLRRRAWNRS
jgi:hypothetical protein